MVGSHPRPWRNVGKVPKVNIAEGWGDVGCPLPKTDRLSCRAEEQEQLLVEGSRFVRPVRVIWGKGDAILGVSSDDGRLVSTIKSAKFDLLLGNIHGRHRKSVNTTDT